MKATIFLTKKMFERYPFLKKIECHPDEIFIKKADKAFLLHTPSAFKWTGSMVDIDTGEKIHFVLSNGSIIYNAVRQNSTEGSNYAHQDTYTENGESVLHAIERHGVADQIVYFVEIQYGIHEVNHQSYGTNIIVWRALPATIADLISMFYKDAEEEVAKYDEI